MLLIYRNEFPYNKLIFSKNNFLMVKNHLISKFKLNFPESKMENIISDRKLLEIFKNFAFHKKLDANKLYSSILGRKILVSIIPNNNH